MTANSASRPYQGTVVVTKSYKKGAKVCVILHSGAKVHQDLHPRVSLGYGISVAFGLHPQHKSI
jgi:hypothetical protein